MLRQFIPLSALACIGLLLSGCVSAQVHNPEDTTKERYKGPPPLDFSIYSRTCHEVLARSLQVAKDPELYRKCVSEKSYYQGFFKICADHVDLYSPYPITTVHSARKGKAFSNCLMSTLRKPIYK